MKKCIICENYLDLNKFYKDSTRTDKHDNKCKECDKNIKIKKRALKKELKKMKYPLGTTLLEQYTNGGRFYLNNKPYIGWFHRIDKKFYTGKQPGSNSKLLETEIKKEEIIKPLELNKNYYIKRVNEGFAKKVGINEFEQYKNNPLYKTVEVNLDDIESINKAKEIIPEIKHLIK